MITHSAVWRCVDISSHNTPHLQVTHQHTTLRAHLLYICTVRVLACVAAGCHLHHSLLLIFQLRAPVIGRTATLVTARTRGHSVTHSRNSRPCLRKYAPV